MAKRGLKEVQIQNQSDTTIAQSVVIHRKRDPIIEATEVEVNLAGLTIVKMKHLCY